MREGIYADVLCPDLTSIQATPESERPRAPEPKANLSDAPERWVRQYARMGATGELGPRGWIFWDDGMTWDERHGSGAYSAAIEGGRTARPPRRSSRTIWRRR